MRRPEKEWGVFHPEIKRKSFKSIWNSVISISNLWKSDLAFLVIFFHLILIILLHHTEVLPLRTKSLKNGAILPGH